MPTCCGNRERETARDAWQVGDLLDGYDATRAWDEMFTAAGDPRPQYQTLFEQVQTSSRSDFDERCESRDRVFRAACASACSHSSQEGGSNDTWIVAGPGGCSPAPPETGASFATFARHPQASREGHAWLDAWVGSWVSVDPTSGSRVAERHVLAARGRDYGDVPPFKGVFHGPPSENVAITASPSPASPDPHRGARVAP